MNKPVRVLIVDDFEMIRDGLRTMLEIENGDITYKVFDTDKLDEAIKITKKESIDVALVDYQLVDLDGALVTSELKKVNPDIKVIAISNYNELNYIQDMITAGANGYVLKNVSSDELVAGIDKVRKGGVVFSPEVSQLMTFQYYKHITSKPTDYNATVNKDARLVNILSNREKEILTMIAQEMSNDEIAKKLFLSKRTVDNHRQNILNKLDVKNSMGLMMLAIKGGLIDIN
jgi:DNA-binding NarL/FixJ family response regulator